MADIKQIRQQYPQYQDLSDQALADALHSKFYSDMDKNEYYQKINLAPAQPEAPEQAQPEQPQQPEQEPGFFGRLAEDVQRRGGMAREIKAATDAGEQSKAEEVLQMAGKVGAGFVGDVTGNVMEAADDLTGNVVSGGAKWAAKQVGKLPSIGGGTLADHLPGEVAMLAEKYGDFQEENPRAARNLEAIVNLGAFLYPAAKSGEKVIKGGKAAAGKIARNAKLNMEKLNSEQLRKMGSDLFKRADELGGVLKPEATNNFIDDLAGAVPQTRFGKAFEGENAVTRMLERVKSLKDQPMTLSDAREVDEILGNMAYSPANMADGKFSAEGRHFLEMQAKLRRMIENAGDDAVVGGKEGFEAVKEARKVWSASLRLRDVERIIENADNYQVPATAIKTGFRTMLRNKNRLTGFTDAEIKAMKKAAQTGLMTDVLGVFGSRLVPIAAGGAGYATGGPLGAAASGLATYATSSAARAGATKIQMGKAGKVADLIRQRLVDQGLVTPQQAEKIGPELLQILSGAGQATAPLGAMDIADDEVQDMTLEQIMRLPPAEAQAELDRRKGR